MATHERKAASTRAVDGGCIATVDTPNSSAATLTIDVVAKMFKMPRYKLRLYELAGLIRRSKTAAGYTFSWSDCERIALIVKAHAAGLRVRTIRTILRAMGEPATTAQAARGRQDCLAQIAALEACQQATGHVLAELYRIDRELAERISVDALRLPMPR